METTKLNESINMITVEQARERILSSIEQLGSEKTDLLSALGRIIAEEVTAPWDIPPKDNSAMDGYALRAEDTLSASEKDPITLEVTEDIPAGSIAKFKVNRGQAARIMTGAPIPEGADSVLRMEDTQAQGDRVKILVPVTKGQDIRWAGEDVRCGDIVLTAGTEIRPAEIGMLASLGRSFISVYQRPTVAVLSTGNELIDIDEDLSAGKIVNSNGYALAAQVRECGAVPVLIGIARDTKEDLLAKFKAAARADLIKSSGGVSVGDYDLVKDIMQEIGNSMAFWRVAMRPGRPLAFGTIQGKPAFGLPGNPVSSMISFEQFVRPALRKMMGHQNLFRKTVKAVLKEDIRKKSGLKYFIRVRLLEENGQIMASSTGEQGSGILKSMVLADGLVELSEDLSEAQKGSIATVQLLR
jgi:molybdopterin molybdotransferase